MKTARNEYFLQFPLFLRNTLLYWHVACTSNLTEHPTLYGFGSRDMGVAQHGRYVADYVREQISTTAGS